MDHVVEQPMLVKAIAGDASAFSALLELHYDLIYSVAWKVAGNDADAEDIAQDVCIKLGKSLSSFEGRSKFTSWLYRVTLNTANDHLKRRKDHTVVEAAERVPDDHASAEEDIENSQLWQLVRKLPERQREAVVLVYSEGHSHADAAEILGCKEGTISWALSEARTTLKDWLKSDD